MSISRTIIIGCAGMGNRLGLGVTKALVDVDGKPLIIRHLEQLANEEDIRIVVGYQAEKVIDLVNDYRKDILFVFNHEYKKTGTGASVSLAAKHANEYILTIDGDLLVHPEDMKEILNRKGEFIGGSTPGTDEPWLLQTYNNQEVECVSSFSKVFGQYEWTGISQVETKRMKPGNGHVYQLLENLLPIAVMPIRTKEIDTINDYEKAVKWVQNNYCD